MKNQPTPPAVLTIGGTDPCGAYGVMADLKTFGALGVYGQAVITVVTAQNSRGWWGSVPISAEMIGQQLRAVLEDYGSSAVKTGYLGRLEAIQAVADIFKGFGGDKIVVDPVLVDGRGRPMFGERVVQAVREQLLPLAAVITPNRGEARLLLDLPPDVEIQFPDVVSELTELAPQSAWLIKGEWVDGHWGDWLIIRQTATFLPQPHIETANTAGSGDTLSAAVAAGLARGLPAAAAVHSAQAFTQQAIARAASWRLASGRGPTANFLAVV